MVKIASSPGPVSLGKILAILQNSAKCYTYQGLIRLIKIMSDHRVSRYVEALLN